MARAGCAKYCDEYDGHEYRYNDEDDDDDDDHDGYNGNNGNE